jgi:hypothetical protein
MSAGAVGVLAPELVRMPSCTPRPRLRLVDPDERVAPGERFGLDDPLDALAVTAIRFTRRGRLVITLMATAAAVALALMLATTVDAAAPQIDHVTTVSAGQTLSEVAATQMPRLLIRDAVARIQLVNGLNTSQVHAGQSLLIPATP